MKTQNIPASLEKFLKRDPRTNPLQAEDVEELQLAFGEYLYRESNESMQTRGQDVVEDWVEVSSDEYHTTWIRTNSSGQAVIRMISPQQQTEVVATFNEDCSLDFRLVEEEDPQMYQVMAGEFGRMFFMLFSMMNTVLYDMCNQREYSTSYFIELMKRMRELVMGMSAFGSAIEGRPMPEESVSVEPPSSQEEPRSIN